MMDLHAVLDLGSNSFRLLVARERRDGIELIERLKESVQLARGLRAGQIDPKSIDRARACLQRFSQRLLGIPRDRIVMVATHAMRVAENRLAVSEMAEAIIGVPVRVLTGAEEAALVYRGVQVREPVRSGAERLVIDIGGGSTEFARGTAAVPAWLRSSPVGCVSLGDRCFGPGVPFRQAHAAVRTVLDQELADLERSGFVSLPAGLEVIGTSGTIESIQAVLAANGWGDRVITPAGLARLVEALAADRWDPVTGMPGLMPERVDIFPAGVALVDGLFARLGLPAMRHVSAALEDGVLYQHLRGDAPPADPRQAALRQMQARFGIDPDQARRVQRTALALFDQVGSGWSLPRQPGDPDWRALLEAAAALHEAGLLVATRAYHRHGAYLLRHVGMAGFTDLERHLIALLVRSHRRSLPLLPFSDLGAADRRGCLRLAALLRLAVILERSHADSASPVAGIVANARRGAHGTEDTLTLTLPPGWLQTHLLSQRELGFEATELARADIRLEVVAS